ncbi:MAG: hypothetical protein GOMPHAMPRED_007524 [Gomphillus americanus]|uniref:Uncharacterized protein n=1 Tax=Gomphillus americanus TaxID=1940652 RepID=A0A8H3EXD1_9LECA|nr:MAG: hypothetical protein GOMPHAMPRED_007524 [Gomphillus americanus]
MQSYFDIKSLLFPAIALFLFWTSYGLAISARHINILNDNDSGTPENAYPMWKFQEDVQRVSANSRAIHTSTNHRKSPVDRGRLMDPSYDFLGELDSPTTDLSTLKRRSPLDKRRSILQARTNERGSPKLQTKTGTSTDHSATKSSETSPQKQKRRAGRLSFLHKDELVSQIPIKRPRLGSSKDGGWIRGGTMTSQATYVLQSHADPKHKQDERARSPPSLAQQLHDSSQGQAEKAVKEPARKSYLVPGAQSHSQLAHVLRQPNPSGKGLARGQYGDATVATKFGSGAPVTGLHPLWTENRQDVSQLNVITLADQPAKEQAVSRLKPDSSNHRSVHLGQTLASTSPRQHYDSGPLDTASNSRRTHSTESQEAAPARPNKRNKPVRDLPPVPQVGGLNRLNDAAQSHAQEPQFKVPPSRFPSSVPQAAKLNRLLDASRASRWQQSEQDFR